MALARPEIDVPFGAISWIFRRDDFEALLGLVVQTRLQLEEAWASTRLRDGEPGRPFPQTAGLRSIWEDAYWLYTRLHGLILHLQRWRT